MSLFKLDLNKQTLIIIITAIIWAINFRLTFNNINYHMDIGNYCSIKFDPFLTLIKNIISIFYFIPYFIELRINRRENNIINNNIENKVVKVNSYYLKEIKEMNRDEDIGEVESLALSNKLISNRDKILFIIKIILLICFIYFSEEIYFIMTNNHELDRTVCPTRNMFALFAILFLSIIFNCHKIDKAQIQNFLTYKKHQIIPLIIIFLLSLFLMLYNPLKIERFKDLYNINLLIYIIIFIFMGFELVFIKYLVDTLFINKFLILAIKGILGTIIFIIINLTTNKNDYYNFFDKLLSFQYDLGNENFYLSFKIFYVITSCFLQYLKIVIVNKFDETHFLSTLMITDIFYFPLYCIERFSVQNFKISTVDTFYINVLIGIINTILMLIFNEILELNFCGCNKYLRKNIIRRESLEIIKIFGNSEDDRESIDEENY